MVDTNKMQFGYNFKRLCAEYGISIKEVSQETGIPLNTLYSITKRKTRDPRDQELKEKVFAFLKTKIPDLTWKDFYPIYDPDASDDLRAGEMAHYLGIRDSLADAFPSFLAYLFNSLNDRGQAEVLKKLLRMKEMDQYKKED